MVLGHTNDYALELRGLYRYMGLGVTYQVVSIVRAGF